MIDASNREAPKLTFSYGDGPPVSVNVATETALMDRIRERLVAGEGFALATINLDHLVKLRHSAAFRQNYAAQDFVVADGNPIVWLGRIAGAPVDLMPGSDLFLPLIRLAADNGQPIALVGSTQESLDKASRVLRADVPNLEVAAAIAPAFGFDPASEAADALLDDLAASGARFTFIALGAPKQEVLAARGRKRLPQMGFAGIGASIDFISGQQDRAPQWVRSLAMEWLWRVANNPARLAGRYARCFAILPLEVLSALRQRRRKRG